MHLYYAGKGLQWLAQRMGFEAGSTGMSTVFTLGLILGCMIIPYLLGNFNTAIILGKALRHEDIRQFGSGNAGTTNVLRTYGKGMAAATLLGDFLKAALAVMLGGLLAADTGAALAGFFVMFGHMFPVFFRFRGGKGVACTAIVILMLSPITCGILLLIFAIIVVGTKYISLASVMCVLLYPVVLSSVDKVLYGSIQGMPELMSILMAGFVVFMHRENIKRLREGTESKVSFRKTNKVAVGAEPADEKKKKEEIVHGDPGRDRFVKCEGCGEIIPIGRKVCAYCNTPNRFYRADADPNQKSRKKK